MKTRILFSTNNEPGSIIIRLATWSVFSHCDLIVGDGTKVIGATALGGPKLFGGVREYPLKDRINASRKWAIYEAEAWRPQVEAAVREQLGKPYDWLGCIGIGLHRDWQEDSAWFCSELIAYGFQKAGYPLLNPELRLNRVRPEDLLRSPRLTYTGFGQR